MLAKPVIDSRSYLAAPQKHGLCYAIDLDSIDDLTVARFVHR